MPEAPIRMIRLLSILGSACTLGGIALLVVDAERFILPAVVLILAAVPIGIFLAIRRAFHTAGNVVRDARAFVTGDVQHARLVEVGDPRGIFFPRSTLVLELEGEDGAVHRFERDVPVPLPAALSYRLGKRLNAPLLRRVDLSELMAFELRREGLKVALGRPASASEPPV